jgi:pimeloyl-ACP methyl ester carboxylesterase
MKINHVQANGLTFAYLEQGAGPAVFFLHGFPDNALICPYLRGYTPTEVPKEGSSYDPATLGKDLEYLIKALSPQQKVRAVGMDWGGTAIHAALVTCPELIEAAVVMNAAHPATLRAFATDPEQTRAVFHFWFFQLDAAARSVAGGKYQMVDYLWKLWSPELQMPEHLQRVKETLSLPGVMQAVLRYYPSLYNSVSQNTFPIGEIKVPTLSIFGSTDPTAKYSALEEPFFNGPYERIVIPGVGHWPHLEREQEFNQRVLEWFGRFST